MQPTNLRKQVEKGNMDTLEEVLNQLLREEAAKEAELLGERAAFLRKQIANQRWSIDEAQEVLSLLAEEFAATKADWLRNLAAVQAKFLHVLDPKFAWSEQVPSGIEDVLNTLSERERRVLELRFGLIDGRSRTLEEVGRDFGVTRERIRQIEAKALRKLRHPTRSRKLRDFLE